MIAAFGVLTAGGVVVPVSTRFKTAEAADIITRSGAKAVLTEKGFLGQDFSTPPGVPAVDLKSGFLEDGRPFERTVSGTDIADIIYTSGTTGRPKGVMMNHAQNLRMYAEWCDLADLREGDRYLIVNPFFHTFGYKAGCIASFIRGATMLPVPVFDADRVTELIAAERVTMLPGPPTLYHSLLAVEDKSKLATLRAGVTGAADIPVELIRRVHEELPFQTLATGYGLTEAGTATMSRPGDSFEDVATTAGLAGRRRRGATRRRRRGARARIQRDAGLLRRPRRHRRGDRCRRVAAHRRSGGVHRQRAARASSAARRTCSSSAASTPTPPRSKAS